MQTYHIVYMYYNVNKHNRERKKEDVIRENKIQNVHTHKYPNESMYDDVVLN